MGLNYSVVLFFPVEQVKQALKLTADWDNSQYYGGKSLEITLPVEGTISVPFPRFTFLSRADVPVGTSSAIDWQLREHVKWFPLRFGYNKHETFYTSMWVPLEDDSIRRYVNAYRDWPQDFHIFNDTQHVSIGTIYLSVWLGNRYAIFEYTAASTNISRLFLNSPSMRKQYQSILKLAGGVAGLIDTEADFRLLDDPEKKVEIEREQFRLNIIDYAVDAFTEHCLQAIDSAVHSE